MPESTVRIIERPKLKNPVLIEGLPGAGFVANIAALQLINELKAVKFAEIHSPAFQDLVVSVKGGKPRSPTNELYYYQPRRGRGLIILYGNTQALTAYGQYEICGRILDAAEDLGCKRVACMGGFRKEKVSDHPRVYCAATDNTTLGDVLKFGTSVAQVHIAGAAGLLLGLAKLRNMRGFCLLVETLGVYPDAVAAEAVLGVLCKVLKINIDLSRLGVAARGTEKILDSSGFLGAQRKPTYPTYV
jgi:uncharacterized protein (TIGR00162 family)